MFITSKAAQTSSSEARIARSKTSDKTRHHATSSQASSTRSLAVCQDFGDVVWIVEVLKETTIDPILDSSRDEATGYLSRQSALEFVCKFVFTQIKATFSYVVLREFRLEEIELLVQGG